MNKLIIKRIGQLLSVLALVLAWPRLGLAHPMPSSLVLLDLRATGVAAEVQVGRFKVEQPHDNREPVQQHEHQQPGRHQIGRKHGGL